MKEPKASSQSILIHVAQDDIPEREIDLWPALHQSLVSSQTIRQQGEPSMFSKRTSKQFLPNTLRFVIGAGLVFAILGAAFVLMPEKHVLAEAFKHLFWPATAEQFPTPSAAEMATPTYAPTFAATLAPVNEIAVTQTPELAINDPTKSAFAACGVDPNGYACKMAKAEQEAGFDAKEFPADPKGFVFAQVEEATPGTIIIRYDVIGGGGYLYFMQGTGGSEFRSTAPQENAVEEVMVGGNQGEYVAGDWIVDSKTKKAAWVSCCRFRLRWTEGDRWFEMDKEASIPSVDYMTREVMIDMAEHLVDHPDPAQAPRMEYLTLTETAQVADFKVFVPSLLPKGFQFGFASYDKDLSQLRLHYYPSGDAMPGDADILIIETPLDKVFLAPSDNGENLNGEKVEINGYPAIYSPGGLMNHAITWQTNQLKITIGVVSSQAYGATFTREQILKIAESLK